MSVLMVETYVVKAEKREAFTPALEEFLRFKEANPDLFEGVRSWSLHRQEYGGIGGLYAEIWEFDDLAAMESINEHIFADDTMSRISKGFHELVDPATFSTSVWRPVASS